MCCEKCLKGNKHNSFHLVQKYACIFVLGHYLFLKAHSFPWAMLLENCSLLKTGNVCGQISVHIFAPNGGYCLYTYCHLEITLYIKLIKIPPILINCYNNYCRNVQFQKISILNPRSKTSGNSVAKTPIHRESFSEVKNFKGKMTDRLYLTMVKFISLKGKLELPNGWKERWEGVT